MANAFFMNSHLVEEAQKVMPNTQVLINLVSQRVRQLNASARPLVETTPGMDNCDIALSEIIAGRLREKAPEPAA